MSETNEIVFGACNRSEAELRERMSESAKAYGFDPATLISLLMPILMQVLGDCIKKRGAAAVASVMRSNRWVAKLVARRAVESAVAKGQLTLNKDAQADVADILCEFARESDTFEEACNEIADAESSFLNVW